MSLQVETRSLTKMFGSFAAVSGVSLKFDPGLIHAVLGENGAGKSTLMKLLFGLHQPTSGEIHVAGKPVRWKSSMDAIASGLGMVQQHFSLVEPLSAIDNIMIGAEVVAGLGRLDRGVAIAKLESLLPTQHLAVPWDTPVSELSVGQKQKVEILKLLFRESKVLFLDEPTAVLAPSEIDDFFSVLHSLKESGRTIVLITHKLNEVRQVCDTYAILRQGHLVEQGQVASASVDAIVEKMIGRKLPEFSVARTPALAQPALVCKNVSESQQERGSLRGVSLTVNAGEVVGVAGVEGSGQSRFVESLIGLRAYQGEIRLLEHAVVPTQTDQVRAHGTGLIPEDRLEQGLWLEETCFKNMVIGVEDRFLKHHVFQESRLQEETSVWAREFDVRASSLDVPAGSLSGGNQQKLIFAREVAGRNPRFLICHQPTRGVDLGAIDLIHRKLIGLRNQGLAVLVLSSELDELLKLCDRIYVFFEGRVVAEFERRNFDRFRIGAAMIGAQHADA